MPETLARYGFAFAGKERAEKWQRLVTEYLDSRKTLKRVCLLVDSRHGLKDSDRQAISMFEKHVFFASQLSRARRF